MRKRGATDRPDLPSPRQSSTLPTMKILSELGLSGPSTGSDPTDASQRKGVFTSGIISVLGCSSRGTGMPERIFSPY